MSSRPRQEATDRRPGLIVALRTKRTTAQKQADEEAARAALKVQEHAAGITHCSLVQKVSSKEDKMHHEDEHTCQHAARPDLLTLESRSPVDDAQAGSDKQRRQPFAPVQPQSNPDVDMDEGDEDGNSIPPASVFDPDSDGMAAGAEDKDEFQADGDDNCDNNCDDNCDEDYVDHNIDTHQDDREIQSDAADGSKFEEEFKAFLQYKAALKAKKAAKGSKKVDNPQRRQAPKVRDQYVTSSKLMKISGSKGGTGADAEGGDSCANH